MHDGIGIGRSGMAWNGQVSFKRCVTGSAIEGVRWMSSKRCTMGWIMESVFDNGRCGTDWASGGV